MPNLGALSNIQSILQSFVSCHPPTPPPRKELAKERFLLSNEELLFCRHFDLDLSEACNMYGVKLLSYGSLNGGFHSGKYLDGKRPEGARHTKGPKFQHRYCSPQVEEALKKYKVLADSQGLSLTELVIAWCACMSTGCLTLKLTASSCFVS